MRLSGRNANCAVTVTDTSIRPIRLRVAGMTFAMDVAEAVQLANDLADAIDTHEGNN